MLFEHDCFLSMISGQTLRVCPEGTPVPTFPDHALLFEHDLSENRFPLFRIMLPMVGT
jgi:hypothetical protein